MAKKPLPSHTPGSSESKSSFMRERLILHVANLRYELDVIAILTPLPPARGPKLALLPTSESKSRRRPLPNNSSSPG